jgi:hypothetical protein
MQRFKNSVKFFLQNFMGFLLNTQHLTAMVVPSWSPRTFVITGSNPVCGANMSLRLCVVFPCVDKGLVTPKIQFHHSWNN